MRGSDVRSGSLFSYVDLEQRVRADHPLRVIREVVNAALADLSADFDALYPPKVGRPSIPPERLLRAMLLQAFYGIRSERQLMERMEFDLLFRWFVGLGVDDAPWDHSSFSTNRDRLLEGDIAAKLLATILAQPKVKRLLSSDHFSVDGTLIDAWASIKSFRKKDGGDQDGDGPGRNAERNFHGEPRSNDTHESTTDPDAKLYKKGRSQPAKLCYLGHALMENRNGLAVGGLITGASGFAEREAALMLVDQHGGGRRITLGADKAYDVRQFIGDLRARGVTSHIAVDGHVRLASVSASPRSSAVDARTTRHAGYALSQRSRKRIEEIFGWIKTSAGLARVKLRGRDRVDAAFRLALSAYNLIRLPKLLGAA
ncbi:MAG: IS5 family transposase [Hyphomonadaceae bacterium]